MYQHVMVPLDGSELAECVLPHVQAIATGCNVGTITLVRVVEPFHLRGGLETDMIPEERQRIERDSIDLAKNYLSQVVKRLKDSGVTVQAEVLHGKVIDGLLDYTTKNRVDLIIIATHGRSGVSRWAHGSVAERVLRSSVAPVLMVRPPGCVPGV